MQDRAGDLGDERVDHPGRNLQRVALAHRLRGDLRVVDVRRVDGHVGRVEQVDHERTLGDEELLRARVEVVAETRTRRGVLLAGDDAHAEDRAVGPHALRLANRATVVVADGLEGRNGQCSHQRPPDVCAAF